MPAPSRHHRPDTAPPRPGPPRRRRTPRLLGVAAAACLLAGCAGTTAGGAAGGGAGGALSATPGFDPATNTITVAALVPLTGPQASAGALAQAFQAYFDWRNATSPIGGKYTVKVDVQDTQFSNSVAYTAFNSVKNTSTMIGLVVGRTEPLVPLLQQNKMVAVADSFSMDLLRNENVIANGAPTELQAVSGMAYAVDKLDAKNKTVCSLTQADDLGKSALAGLTHASATLGFPVAAGATYTPGPNSDFSGQIQTLKAAGCQVVLFGGNPPAFIGSIVASSQLSFAPQWITTNTAVTAPAAFSAIAGYLTANKVLFVGNGPAWDTTSVVGQKNMVAALKQYTPAAQASLPLASGWADASYAAGILERAVTSGDLSHAGVLAAANMPGTLSSQGVFNTDFVTGAPAARVPIKSVTLFQYSPGTPSGMAPVEQNYQPSATTGYPLP